jgi:hypothetical protein
MNTPPTRRQNILGVTHRELLKAGRTAGVALSAWPLHHPRHAGLGKQGS